MVRLKDSKSWDCHGREGYFNSNMVRLKAENFVSDVYGFALFQFQYGAIKRRQGVETLAARKISIPIWCD